MGTKNKTISYLGWFLVWLKDKDKNLVIEQKNQRVYIWRQGTPFHIFKSYFQSKEKDILKSTDSPTLLIKVQRNLVLESNPQPTTLLRIYMLYDISLDV